MTKTRCAVFLLILLAMKPTGIGRQEPERLPAVSTLHPRIFIRHDAASLGRGLTIGQLRSRTNDPVYAQWRRQAAGEGPTGMVERAARYLEEGTEGDLEAVRRYLLTHRLSQAAGDVTRLLAGADMAIALDWVYGGLCDVDRSAAMANVATAADSSYNFLIQGQPDINHNYTYMALYTVALCGIVLKGEPAPYDDKARQYLDMAQRWLEGRGKVLDTWKAREGAWGEGSHYTFHETVRTLVMTLQAYRTATSTDYFTQIERHYGNFIARAGRFMIASTRPDLTFERIGDVAPSRTQAAITVPLTVEALASGLNDSEEAARLRSFAQALLEAYGDRALHPSFDWGMRIFFDARASLAPSYKTLPLSMRLGAGTSEQIVFRNGWETDSTQITLLAGDHYTDHQHFDKGHFLIYRRGGLVVDSGTYDRMYEPNGHWNNYACRTLAHNCVLVYDPHQTFPRGYNNDGGQTVLRGLQHHADWPSYLADYRKEKLDTASVLAYDWDQKSRYGYVRCDLTGAYTAKVTFYDRQFVYLPAADLLVVFDRVSAARPEYSKRWLLHFQERPNIDQAAPEPGIGRFPGARLTSIARRGELALGGRTITYDGELFVHTLLPIERTVEVIGGPGFEYFNSFQGLNFPPAQPVRAIDLRESGAWRMEVSPVHPSRDDQFLHALQIADGRVRKRVDTRLLAESEEKMVGVQFLAPLENQIVLFARDQKGGPVSLPVRYEVSSPVAARHLLPELEPLQIVVVEIDGKASLPLKTNSQGVLSFTDGVKGRRKIAIRPAPRNRGD